MKKIFASMVAAIALAATLPALSYSGSYVPGTGINGTPHDMNRRDTGMAYKSGSDTRICIFCHAPHNTYRLSTATKGQGPIAPEAFTYLPLWNHQLQSTTYEMYENGPGAPVKGHNASQAILIGSTPGNVSLLCLSCHDGSIAVNQYGNVDQPAASRGIGIGVMAPQYTVGAQGYLGNHHPVGFNYAAVRTQDTQIRDPQAYNLTNGSTIQEHLFGSDNLLECASCHSVHNKGNSGEKLLWRSDQNSELCLTCHDKGIYTNP